MRVIKRLRFDSTTHPVLARLAGLGGMFGGAISWLGRLVVKFSRAERLVLTGLFIVIVVGGALAVAERTGQGEHLPVSGGVQVEGLVGTPRYIQPLLAETNNVDRDLVRLIYSGLTRISPGREVLPDLAISWDSTDSGRTYVFHLRNDVLWHDEEVFTAEDVVYTVNVLQNDSYRGVLKSSFAGVGVEAIDDYTVRFTLPSASAFFLYDIAVPIIPKHIYQDVPVSDFQSFYTEAKIIGTGPYHFDKSTPGESVTLARFKGYYGDEPYLERLVFFFFDSEKSLLAAFKSRAVSAAGFTDLRPEGTDLTPNDIRYVYPLPQYRGVFFNQLSENNAIKDKAVRQALALATNKQQLIDQVEGGKALIVDSPVLPGFWGHDPDIKKYEFNIAKAAEILKRARWADIDGDGILERDGTRLSFRVTIRDDAKSKQTAELLQRSWNAIGADVAIESWDAATLIKDIIRPRSYEVLIFGQDLGTGSDPYVYWHSSQIQDPGLALAVQFDKDIDNSLEAARTAASLNQTIVNYHRFQTAFADLVPAILLYQPYYVYLVDAKVKGVTDQINLSLLSDRFSNTWEWYIKTK